MFFKAHICIIRYIFHTRVESKCYDDWSAHLLPKQGSMASKSTVVYNWNYACLFAEVRIGNVCWYETQLWMSAFPAVSSQVRLNMHGVVSQHLPSIQHFPFPMSSSSVELPPWTVHCPLVLCIPISCSFLFPLLFLRCFTSLIYFVNLNCYYLQIF